jgi:hypothetical protein
VSSLVTRGAPFVPLLFVLGFLIVSIAIGRRLLQWLGAVRGGSPAERTIIALALGAGSLQVVPLALGALHILTVPWLRVAIGIVTVLAVWDLRGVTAYAFRELRWPQVRPWHWAWIAALLPAVLFAFVLALAPTIDADGLGYHLTVPKRWLQSGSLAYLPTYAYSNAPMGVEMLFAIALAFAGDAGAKCLHFLLGISGATGLYLAGKRLYGPVVGAAATTLFLVGPLAVVPMLGLAYIEGAVAFSMIAATIAWLLWFQGGERGWLRCAALLAGVAVSFKMTAALFPVMMVTLTVGALILDEPGDGRLPGSLRASSRDWTLLPLIALPVVPWLLRSALVTGNPFFPMFAALIPSRDLSPVAAAAFEHHFRYWNWGTSLGEDWDLAKRRWLLVAAGSVALFFGACAFGVLRSKWQRTVVLVMVGTVLLQIAAVGLYMRFWIALTSVLALPVVASFGRVVSNRWAVVGLILLTGLGSTRQVSRESATISGDIGGLARAALGVDRHGYLNRRVPVLPIYDYANRELPEHSGILMTYSCLGFYLERTTFCDETIQDSIRWTTWDEFVLDLRDLGVTHVIAPRTLATGGPAPPVGRTGLIDRHERHGELLRRLLSEHAQLLFSAADQGLYALEPSLTHDSR